MPNSELLVPQMWYWTTWLPEDNQMKFYPKTELEEHLLSFNSSNPHNNHMCRIFADRTEVPIPSTLKEENELVMTFFEERGPYATWNGERDLWGSALNAVKAMAPLFSISKTNTLENLADISVLCLEFLVKINSFLPNQTLFLADNGAPDILLVSRSGAKWYRSRADNG
jgi:hypothetical protein